MKMDSVDSNLTVGKAVNYFGINLYKELSKEKGNVFFSPFSLSSALAMAFIGSSQETSKEMSRVLGYETAKIEYETIKNNFRLLFSETNKSSNLYELSIANVVLSDCELLVQEEFKKVLVDFFEALFVDVDFVNEATAVLEKANSWVKSKTNNMVSHLLHSLDSNTKMLFLNAVYFKGFWLHAFKEKSTFLQYFYNNGLEDEAKLVEMMHLKEKFFYAENVSYKTLKLPYKGDNLAIFFLLPNSKNGLAELESQLSTEFLRDIKANLFQNEVEVALPKFCLEYSKSLKNNFQNLGMVRAFEAGASFDKISEKENLLISDVIHKAVLEISEEGTEVAAATAVVMNRYCITHCLEFIIDHPFLFLIYDCNNDLILFMGKVIEL